MTSNDPNWSLQNIWNHNEQFLSLLVNSTLNLLFMLSFMIIIVSLTLTRNLYLFGLQQCLVQITGMLNSHKSLYDNIQGIIGLTDSCMRRILVGHLTKFIIPVKQGLQANWVFELYTELRTKLRPTKNSWKSLFKILIYRLVSDSLFFKNITVGHSIFQWHLLVFQLHYSWYTWVGFTTTLVSS